MGIRIPFTEFQRDVLDHLQVAASQLALNGWGYLRTFETVMEFLGRKATKKVFFCFFFVLRQPEKDPEKEMPHRAAAEYPTLLARALHENWELKEKVEKLQGVQAELNEVNKKISEQSKQLKELPATKVEAKRARDAEKALREESSTLREEKVVAEERANKAGAEGFRQALDLRELLAPWVNFDYYDGNHFVKDDEIWLGEQMVLDVAQYRKSREEARGEEEKSPEDQPTEPKADGEAGTGEA